MTAPALPTPMAALTRRPLPRLPPVAGDVELESAVEPDVPTQMIATLPEARATSKPLATVT